MMSSSLIPRSNKLKGSGVIILSLEESGVNNCLGPRGTLGILRVPQGCSGLVGASQGSSGLLLLPLVIIFGVMKLESHHPLRR